MLEMGNGGLAALEQTGRLQVWKQKGLPLGPCSILLMQPWLRGHLRPAHPRLAQGSIKAARPLVLMRTHES